MTESPGIDLSRFRFVLVETAHPGNLGAAARAMKNMGLRHLVLLRPHRHPDPEALWRATNAEDLLASATVVNTLEAAIGDCVLVLGTSARARRLPWPIIQGHKLGHWMAQDALPAEGTVAILFGREASGLNNEELQACHAHIMIDTSPEYSSLNLAMAVQIVCYELRIGSLRQTDAQPDMAEGVLALPEYWDTPAASHNDIEHLLAHIQQILLQMQYYDPDNPRQLLTRLRRLVQRVRLDHLEVGMLRGFLKEVQRHFR